jgi:hypothetical protein
MERAMETTLESLKSNETPRKWKIFNVLHNMRFKLMEFDVFVTLEGNTKCVIELDGVQHFEAVEFFGGQDCLTGNIAHDRRKDDHCKSQGYHLLRIAYDVPYDQYIATVCAFFDTIADNPGKWHYERVGAAYCK